MLILAGCASEPGEWPSLATRPIERAPVAAAVPTPAPPPQQPDDPRPDPVVVRAELTRVAQASTAQAATLDRKVTAARPADPDSLPRAEAEAALSRMVDVGAELIQLLDAAQRSGDATLAAEAEALDARHRDAEARARAALAR